MTFLTPAALLGLALVPALPVIYLLIQRTRRRTVSSLFLWGDRRVSPEGGRRIRPPRMPFLFFLELLALLLLVLAAAGPAARRASRRPLVLVLDDSFSMRAGGEDSPRSRALAAISAGLDDRSLAPVHVLLAGAGVETLEPARTLAEARARLSAWRCAAPRAALEEGALLARELGGGRARVVVVTDHAPPAEAAGGDGLEWWAFGRKLPNAAIVAASRRVRGSGEVLLVEVASSGVAPSRLDVRIAADPAVAAASAGTAPPSVDQARALELTPGAPARLFVELPPGAPAVRVKVPGDALAFDDEALLLPASRPRPRVDARVAGPLRDSVTRALEASGAVLVPAGTESDLVVTDAGASPSDRSRSSRAWTVRLLDEGKNAVAFAGPFVLDGRHPLTDGVSLAGVIWGGGKERLPGHPVIAAADVPLLVDRESPDGAREIVVRISPRLSTLTESPAWPALFWNLLAWRAGELPGPRDPNVRLGETALVALPPGAASATLRDPSGAERSLVPSGRLASFTAALPGIHTVRAEGASYPVAVNALDAAESDLSACASGRWGSGASRAASAGAENLGWLAALSALGILVPHRWLARREGGGERAGSPRAARGPARPTIRARA